MVLHLGTPAGAQMRLGHGETNRVGNALAQGAGGGLNPGHMAIFRVTCGDGTPLAEVLDLLQRHVLIAGQMQKRIDQHRAVTGREDEAVPVRPTRSLGIKLQVFFKEHRRHIGHAHWHAGMARICCRHRIKRQRADRGGAHPVVGVAGAEGFDIQGGSPVIWLRALRVHSSMGGKIKRGPQGFGGKHKTAGGQAAMIGLDAGFAIRNAGEDLALGRNPVAGIFAETGAEKKKGRSVSCRTSSSWSGG